MPVYSLPDLPYDYSALEPHVSARIMQLHHDRHHRAYVDGANQALDHLGDARAAGEFEKVEALERALAFNLSGHVLHSLFWKNLRPGGGGPPQGVLAKAIERDFGSFDAFRRQMTRCAATVFGSGWAALVWEPVAGRLMTMQILDHQDQCAIGAFPLMVLDAWEHAYYLQYGPDKAKYVDAIWNAWNWEDVARRYDGACLYDLRIKAEPKTAPPVPA